jgi:hypothetical protein
VRRKRQVEVRDKRQRQAGVRDKREAGRKKDGRPIRMPRRVILGGDDSKG